MRLGAFGFEVNELIKHPSYVNEKIGGRRGTLGSSAEGLAALINGVIAELRKL